MLRPLFLAKKSSNGISFNTLQSLSNLRARSECIPKHMCPASIYNTKRRRRLYEITKTKKETRWRHIKCIKDISTQLVQEHFSEIEKFLRKISYKKTINNKGAQIHTHTYLPSYLHIMLFSHMKNGLIFRWIAVAWSVVAGRQCELCRYEVLWIN